MCVEVRQLPTSITVVTYDGTEVVVSLTTSQVVVSLSDLEEGWRKESFHLELIKPWYIRLWNWLRRSK